MGAPTVDDRLHRITAVSRRRGRGPVIAMLGFLAGLLCAALFIPGHAGTGPTSPTGLGATPGSASPAGTSGGGPSGANGTAGGAPGTSPLAASGDQTAGAAGGGATEATASGDGAATVSGAGATGSATAGGNGGATATGVSATSINIGILGGDSSDISVACPRCGQGGIATDEATVSGLLALWHRQGKLPVYGRDIKPYYQSSNDLDASGASQQTACERLVGDKAFVTITGTGATGGDTCLTKQHHTLLVDAGGGVITSDVKSVFPLMWEVGNSTENALYNFAFWADQQGLLKGQVLGMYAPADSSTYGNIQEIINATFVAELKKLGYHLTVDYAWSGEGTTDDGVAAQKMKAAGVTVVFVLTGFTEPAGFQNQAQQLNYHPKYPAAGYGSSSFTDATADLAWNANAENGNNLFATNWWGPWTVRQPATTTSNASAQECINAYENSTHTSLDVYNDDAKLLYILAECSALDVILRALQAAGPHLTQASFVSGIETIRQMQTPMYWSVTFGPTKPFGSDDWQLAQFSKNKWQPSNDYINRIGSPQPWYAQY